VRRSVKAVAGIVGGLALSLVSVVGWMALAPRDAPAGQPALDRLHADDLPAFRDAFNVSPETVRLLVLLSPT